MAGSISFAIKTPSEAMLKNDRSFGIGSIVLLNENRAIITMP